MVPRLQRGSKRVAKKGLRKISESPQKTENRVQLVPISNDKHRYLANETATAHATVAPTIGLLPIPIKPIISTCAGTEELPAN